MPNKYTTPFGSVLGYPIGYPIGFSTAGLIPSVPLNGSERVIAKGAAMPTVNNFSALNRTRIEGRGLVQIGGQAAKSLRMVFWNGFVTGGEQAGSNAITIACALENLTGGAGNVTKVGKFGAATYKRLSGGEYVVSEPFYPADFGLSEFPANWEGRWRTDCVFDVQGHLIPYPASPSQAIAGVYSVGSNSTVSQLGNTGALVVPPAGSPTFGKTDAGTNAGRLQPVAIIGEWVNTADISVAIFGDSIQERYNDLPAIEDGTAGGAMSLRALRSVGGRAVPFIKMAKQGERAANWTAASNGFRRFLMGFCTHMIDNTGTNDINGGLSVSTTITNLQEIWSDFKANAKGAKRIIRLPLLPITTSTDSWTTLANQTAVANYTAGGNRDILNSDIASAIGTNGFPDELININSVLEDAGGNKWVVNGTANYTTDDGIHPTPAGHVLAAALINTAAANWTPDFSPSNISGLSLWLDAADTATITQAANLVSQWNDKSGNNYHATQGTGSNQPTTNTRTINGRNVLDFDGSNDGMILPSGLYTIAGANYTLFVVNASDVTAAGSRQTLTGESTPFTVDFGIQYGPVASPNLLAFGGGTNATRTVTRDTNQHTFVVRRGTINTLLYADGGSGGSGTSNNETLVNMTLGYSPSYGDRWDGVFAEILLYNRELTVAETNNIANNYLVPKWGVPWTNI